MDNRFQVYFEQSAQAFILVKDGIIVDCNLAAVTLLGYNDKFGLLGKHPAEISPEYQPDGELSVIKAEKYINITKEKKSFAFEWTHIKKDGTEIIIEVILTYLSINNEEILHGVWNDLTDKKQKERELTNNIEFQKKLITTVPDIVVVADNNGIITYVNDELEKISDYKKEDVLGKHMFSFFHPDDVNKAKINTEKMIYKALGPIDYRFVKKNGSIVFLEVNGDVLRDIDQNIFGFVYICRDISEKKKAEKELFESEQRFKILQEAAFSGVLIHNKGKILEVSQSFCDMSGYNYDELIGSETAYLFPAEFNHNIVNQFIRISNTPFVTRLIRKTGLEVDVEILTRQIPFKGRLAQVAEIRNVSERMITEAKLKEYARKLEEVNQTKDKLFSIIAHDLRSPFQGLLGYSELLYGNFNDLEKEEIRVIIESIYKSQKSLYSLIENLLYWTRLQTDGFTFNPEKLNLKEKIEEVLSNFHLNISNKSIIIEVKVEQNIIVTADSNMLSSILHNVISNAIKFSYEKGIILICASYVKDKVVIEIKDEGKGILKEDLKKLFKIGEVFTQLGTANEKGTGLGLVLVKEMLELHNGKITVESNGYSGTTIVLTLPKGD